LANLEEEESRMSLLDVSFDPSLDCSGKNTNANNGTYPTRKDQEKCREDNNERKIPRNEEGTKNDYLR
jgi:hypothetical protein